MAQYLVQINMAEVIGAIMHLNYRKGELERASASARSFEAEEAEKPFGTVVAFFNLMVSILVFANWAARGLDMMNAAYHYLDLVPKGRDESDLPWPMAWLRRHDEYD